MAQPTVAAATPTEIGGIVALSYVDSDLEVRTTISGWPLHGSEFQTVDPERGLTPATRRVRGDLRPRPCGRALLAWGHST